MQRNSDDTEVAFSASRLLVFFCKWSRLIAPALSKFNVADAVGHWYVGVQELVKKQMFCVLFLPSLGCALLRFFWAGEDTLQQPRLSSPCLYFSAQPDCNCRSTQFLQSSFYLFLQNLSFQWCVSSDCVTLMLMWVLFGGCFFVKRL